MTCAVRGCEETATTTFQPEHTGIRLEWPVCGFHDAALSAGEKYRFGEDGHSEILLGSAAPLDIVNFKVSTDVSGSMVTFILGHDGIESQRVELVMKPEQARALCFWVGGGTHNFDGALPDPT